MMESPAEHEVGPNCSEVAAWMGARTSGWMDGWLGWWVGGRLGGWGGGGEGKKKQGCVTSGEQAVGTVGGS